MKSDGSSNFEHGDGVSVSAVGVVQRAVRVVERSRCRMRAETNKRRTLIDAVRVERVRIHAMMLRATINESAGFSTKGVEIRPTNRDAGTC